MLAPAALAVCLWLRPDHAQAKASPPQPGQAAHAEPDDDAFDDEDDDDDGRAGARRDRALVAVGQVAACAARSPPSATAGRHDFDRRATRSRLAARGDERVEAADVAEAGARQRRPRARRTGILRPDGREPALRRRRLRRRHLARRRCSAEASTPAPAARRCRISARRRGARVAAPAPRPVPGARVQREAQTSLIGSGSFEMPSLHFLSEPKNVVRDSSLSKDALEQNARLLEGVLEDFGVKGEIIHVRPGPGRHALRAGAGARHQVVARHRPGRRHRPLDERDRLPASPSCPAATPSASNCPTPSARPSICARSWPAAISRRPRRSWRWRSARRSMARRSSSTSPRCRTCWSPAPPARASRWRSTP